MIPRDGDVPRRRRHGERSPTAVLARRTAPARERATFPDEGSADAPATWSGPNCFMMQPVCSMWISGAEWDEVRIHDARGDLSQVRRTSLDGSLCAVARSLDSVGDWWSLLIVRDAFAGRRRFGEFQRSLGTARNILAARLKSLVAQGILEVVPASDGSAYQEYVLTAKGRGLLPVLVALGQWGSEYLFESGEGHSVFVDAGSQRPLRKLEVRAEDGASLCPGDVLVGVVV